jgi:hypothetical protein
LGEAPVVDAGAADCGRLAQSSAEEGSTPQALSSSLFGCCSLRRPTLRVDSGARARLPQPISELHLLVAAVGLGVEGGLEVLIQEGNQLLSQKDSPGHPLEVAAAAVVVGTVELASGEGLLEPAEEGLVIGVHPQRDVRLAAVSSEVSVADQESQEDADFENGRALARGFGRGCRARVFAGLFHRRVSRGT